MKEKINGFDKRARKGLIEKKSSIWSDNGIIFIKNRSKNK